MEHPIIYEDLERIALREEAYIHAEREHMLLLEWHQWEDEQERLNKQPAKIVVKTEEENEINSITPAFRGDN